MSALSGHRRRTTSLWLQNARGEGIRFRIVSAPALGRILKDGAPTDNFTQLDLREAAVEYANNSHGVARLCKDMPQRMHDRVHDIAGDRRRKRGSRSSQLCVRNMAQSFA